MLDRLNWLDPSGTDWVFGWLAVGFMVCIWLGMFTGFLVAAWRAW